MHKANELIRALGEDVSLNVHVIAVTRLPSKLNNRPGIFNLWFRDKDEKNTGQKEHNEIENTEEMKVFIKK